MPRVQSVEFASLTGRRPRSVGSNARIGPHGQSVSPPVAVITLDDGSSGFGWARGTEEAARGLLGIEFDALFDDRTRTVRPEWRQWDFPLWDLAGKRDSVPVYELVNRRKLPGPVSVPCYDTSLYIDDLELDSDDAACELLADEAGEGMALGHAAFKIKIGRGALHMPLEEGTARDIRIIRAVREAVGPEGRIMVDANNGLNYSLSCRILSECADSSIYWLEEPFHEDGAVYRRLKEWMASKGSATLIADGEGDASPRIEVWAAESLIDVVQYDLRALTFSGWIEHGARFDAAGIRSAPHNYGEPTTNYYAAHLFPAIARFEMVEWDEASIDGISAPGYSIDGGRVAVPSTPGFGLELDRPHFERAVRENGFSCR